MGFWKNISVGSADKCWPWSGCRDRDGYGRCRYPGMATRRAHRVAYVLARGPIPSDAVVRHKCDNPPCCNPGHLETGSSADNARDAKRRGRLPRGEDHGRAKLTWEKVTAIRTRFAAGGVSKAALAREFGIHDTSVGFIIREQQWK